MKKGYRESVAHVVLHQCSSFCFIHFEQHKCFFDFKLTPRKSKCKKQYSLENDRKQPGNDAKSKIHPFGNKRRNERRSAKRWKTNKGVNAKATTLVCTACNLCMASWLHEHTPQTRTRVGGMGCKALKRCSISALDPLWFTHDLSAPARGRVGLCHAYLQRLILWSSQLFAVAVGWKSFSPRNL